MTWEDQQANDHQNGEYGSKRDANVSSMNGADKTALDMIAIHRHFHSLERQQLSVMEMLQVNFSPPEHVGVFFGNSRLSLIMLSVNIA